MKRNYSSEEREYMEHLSDLVRQGEPISMNQALLVIQYQGQKRKEAKELKRKSLWNRFKKYLGIGAKPNNWC